MNWDLISCGVIFFVFIAAVVIVVLFSNQTKPMTKSLMNLTNLNEKPTNRGVSKTKPLS
jgi:hypothetical protein